MQTHQISLRGAGDTARTIAYTDTDYREAEVVLILLHGFCEDKTLWQTSPFKAFPLIRTIAPDLAGFGSTAQLEPPNGEAARMADYAADVTALIDALELRSRHRRIVVAGHSMGGYVALEMWQRCVAAGIAPPFDGLLLVHSHPFADREERQAARLKTIEFVRRVGAEAFIRTLYPSLYAPAFAAAHPHIVAAHLAANLKHSADAVCAALEAMRGRTDTTHLLRTATLPVGWVIGTLDSAIPLEDTLALSSELAHSSPDRHRTYILEGIGHLGMIEATRVNLAAMIDFVNFVRKG